MAEEPAPTSFNFASMDWDAYVRFRPVYPQELYSIIYGYHDSHKGAYDSAVDVGAGIGVVSVELTKKFSHVTVTDAYEAYVSQAQTFFSRSPPGRIAVVQSKAEELSLEKLPHGRKVDLVTAAECLHWADLEVVVPAMASLLRSGGTLAAWMYGGRPVLSEQSSSLAEVREIFYKIYYKMANQYDTQIQKQDESTTGPSMNARLDNMPLPSASWTDVRRIHANREASMVHEGWPTQASKVAEGEKVEKFANQKILCHDADYAFLEGYLENWIPPLNIKEFAKLELAQLKEAMGGRKIGVTWPFVLVLATKK